SWKAFMADPDWNAARTASEVNGKLVEKADSIFLAATDFSPEIKPSAGAVPRLFELRTYTASTGHLENLLARFRDHTLKLFTKHGMANFGYWTPVEKKDGAAEKLVYMLAHKNKEARDASFASFRADSDWVAAKKASEDKAGGSLTSVPPKEELLIPTDYSPTK
ncbi:MAG: NIPSNAP family protein, partial [Verrucomicrobia bacterium]|nr:NIPSNAP family protein [Verrucomicrobiota bacterium]